MAPDPPAGDGVDTGRLHEIVRATFRADADRSPIGVTQALMVVHRDRTIVEQYAPDIDAATTLPSWSIAKSVLHALAGLMVRDAMIDLDDVIVRPEWSAPGDPRRSITIRHALEMRTGLAWREDYVDDGTSNVVAMLYGDGRGDVAAYAASQPPAHEPGSHYSYSSGTTNLLSAHLGHVLRAHDTEIGAYLRDELFTPAAMTTAIPKYDDAGTWIASTYCFATTRDFARFGALYLHDGHAPASREAVLPPGWVELGRTPQPDVDDEGWGYGMHWWTLPTMPGAFFANGYQGQFVLIVPDRDLVVVRLGLSALGAAPACTALLHEIVACLDPGAGTGRR